MLDRTRLGVLQSVSKGVHKNASNEVYHYAILRQPKANMAIHIYYIYSVAIFVNYNIRTSSIYVGNDLCKTSPSSPFTTVLAISLHYYMYV